MYREVVVLINCSNKNISSIDGNGTLIPLPHTLPTEDLTSEPRSSITGINNNRCVLLFSITYYHPNRNYLSTFLRIRKVNNYTQLLLNQTRRQCIKLPLSSLNNCLFQSFSFINVLPHCRHFNKHLCSNNTYKKQNV